MTFVYIILYWIFLGLVYRFVLRRIKLLSQWHFNDTWIEDLRFWYKIIKRRVTVLFIILFILSSLVLLTLNRDGIFYPQGLYNNQKTLDINGF
jgi:hypothetical protein